MFQLPRHFKGGAAFFNQVILQIIGSRLQYPETHTAA